MAGLDGERLAGGMPAFREAIAGHDEDAHTTRYRLTGVLLTGKEISEAFVVTNVKIGHHINIMAVAESSVCAAVNKGDEWRARAADDGSSNRQATRPSSRLRFLHAHLSG